MLTFDSCLSFILRNIANMKADAAESFHESLIKVLESAFCPVRQGGMTEEHHVLHLFRHPAAIQCSHFFNTNTLDIHDNVRGGLISGRSAIPKLLSCLH